MPVDKKTKQYVFLHGITTIIDSRLVVKCSFCTNWFRMGSEVRLINRCAIGLNEHLSLLATPHQRAPALRRGKKHGMDLYGDHTSTCMAHSVAAKSHDWAVGVPSPLLRSAGHVHQGKTAEFFIPQKA